jgi:hypothetical protein
MDIVSLVIRPVRGAYAKVVTQLFPAYPTGPDYGRKLAFDVCRGSKFSCTTIPVVLWINNVGTQLQQIARFCL